MITRRTHSPSVVEFRSLGVAPLICEIGYTLLVTFPPHFLVSCIFCLAPAKRIEIISRTMAQEM